MYTNFGQNGGRIWGIIEIGIDMYSWSGRKKKSFSKMSVRPSVRPCAKVMYTKTRVKIIECCFFCLKGAYRESKCRNFRPDHTKAYEVRAEWNLYRFFYISGSERVKIIEFGFFCLKGVIKTLKISTRTHEGLRSWSRMKF